jgi:hypothetical protein
MRTTYLLLFFALSAALCSCKKEVNKAYDKDACVPDQSITESSSKQQDMLLINQLWDQIIALSGSSNCQRSNGWGIVPVGSKPCGGPWTYLAYRLETDVDCLMQKIKYYNQQQSIYNTKYGVGSDCSVPPVPKAVSCESGVPVFVY